MACTSQPCSCSFLVDGQRDGAAHAAADHGDLFQPLGVGGNAQRADKILMQRLVPLRWVSNSIVEPPTIWKIIVTVPP